MQKELFQLSDYITPKWYNFKNSPLGRVYDSIPWDQLSELLPQENRGPGAPRWFSSAGMFALMFLKAYLKISDQKLIERFNTDWSLQLFCGKYLKDDQRIRDNSIVSRTRSYLAEHVDLFQLQDLLINHWKRDMNNTHVLLMDATCYESYLRFPTDVKLLWESCQWVYEKQIFKWCRRLSVKRPRSKYREQKWKQRDYDRRRRKTHRQGLKRKRSLIYLLDKGLNQLQELLNKYSDIHLSSHERQYIRTIRKVLEQQTFLLTHQAKELKGRIVSLPRPYIRPIVRGKENKRVEFGMKVHMLQVDGICMIDKMDFNSFNESTRLRFSVLKHKSLFGHCNQLGADRIYATNANRRYATDHKIFTSFPKKGPKTDLPQEIKLRKILSSARATIMEGSFGTHKQHYGLDRIKAKGAKREMLWAFFSVLTSNAVLIGKRRALEKSLRQAA
ncbi:MAG: transposase [Ignavibacteriaceae bacterium]